MHCEHSEQDLVLTPELLHYGKNVCRQCGRFMGWAKKPETVTREARNAVILAALKEKPLTEWEKQFVLSLEKQGRHFSPKQQDILVRLADEYAI